MSVFREEFVNALNFRQFAGDVSSDLSEICSGFESICFVDSLMDRLLGSSDFVDGFFNILNSISRIVSDLEIGSFSDFKSVFLSGVDLTQILDMFKSMLQPIFEDYHSVIKKFNDLTLDGVPDFSLDCFIGSESPLYRLYMDYDLPCELSNAYIQYKCLMFALGEFDRG